MNKRILLFALMLLTAGISMAQVGISSVSITPDASAMLEVRSTNSGVLVPRVTLSSTLVAAPVTTPATSLLVYNTATAGDVTPGFYYWDSSKWVRLLSGAMPADAWKLVGNAGTVATSNFIGTTDGVDFVTRTNNTERARILSAGNVLVNRTTALYATDLFEAQGNATFPDAISGYTNQAAGTGVYGGNTTASGAGSGCGVYGATFQTGASGVFGDGDAYTTGTIGYTEAAGFDGVSGYNVATSGAGLGSGVYGESMQTGAAGVWGSGSTFTRGVLSMNNSALYATTQTQNAAAGGDALYAVNTATAGTGTGTAIYASSNQYGCASIMSVLNSTSYYANSALSAINGSTYETTTPKGIGAGVTADDGIGIMGVNSAATGTATGDGVYGTTAQGAGLGVYGYNSHTNGTGVMGTGNNASGAYLTDGSGGAFTGTNSGSFSKATSTTGTAVLGAGNNLSAYTLTGEGSGGAFTGATIGVYGTAHNSANDTWGGYFDNSYGAYAYVGGTTTGGTDIKISGSGTAATIVSRPDNTKAIMFCTEAPEILFQDYGVGKLVNGRAHIELDPILVQNILVDANHPLKVFIQLEGECNGIYVTNKTQTGFDVVELSNGQSNIEFSWSIVANRADAMRDNGTYSKNADVRFPDAPLLLKKEAAAESTKNTIDLSTGTDDHSKQIITKGKKRNVSAKKARQ